MGDVARGVPVTSKVGRVKFDELIENLCNEYQANGRRSLDVLRIRCNKHLLPFFGGRRASTITTADINRYVVKRQTEAGSFKRHDQPGTGSAAAGLHVGCSIWAPDGQALHPDAFREQRPHGLFRERALHSHTSTFAGLPSGRWRRSLISLGGEPSASFCRLSGAKSTSMAAR